MTPAITFTMPTASSKARNTGTVISKLVSRDWAKVGIAARFTIPPVSPV
jgi:hypothetical protein